MRSEKSGFAFSSLGSGSRGVGRSVRLAPFSGDAFGPVCSRWAGLDLQRQRRAEQAVQVLIRGWVAV
jgi:hypothetical protein